MHQKALTSHDGGLRGAALADSSATTAMTIAASVAASSLAMGLLTMIFVLLCGCTPGVRGLGSGPSTGRQGRAIRRP